jgi:hypothetical protein
MPTGPATLLLLAICAVLMIVGSVLIYRVLRAGKSPRECASCRHRNAAAARFCGQCGRPL